MDIFERFNQQIDTQKLNADAKEVKEFKEVPHGEYNVAITKMEVKPTKDEQKLLLAIQLKVNDGEYKNGFIFYNQVITTSFGLHNANEFLRTLDSGVEIDFKDFKQYNNLVLDIFEKIGKLEYTVEYAKNDKGYNTFKILEVFEKEV